MTQAYGRPLVFARSLTVLALLGGLFAMHVLVSGTHAAHAAATTAMPGQMVTGTTAMPGQAVTDDFRAPWVGTAAPGRPDSPGMVLVALCVAVLVAVGAALVLRRQGRETVARPPVVIAWRQRSAAPSRGPPRDLLGLLGVLRI